jgi:hypothetical protein
MPGCSSAAPFPFLVAGRRKKTTREPSGDQLALYSEVGLEVKSRTPPLGLVATSSVLPTPTPTVPAPATKTMEPGPCAFDDPQAERPMAAIAHEAIVSIRFITAHYDTAR